MTGMQRGIRAAGLLALLVGMPVWGQPAAADEAKTAVEGVKAPAPTVAVAAATTVAAPAATTAPVAEKAPAKEVAAKAPVEAVAAGPSAPEVFEAKQDVLLGAIKTRFLDKTGKAPLPEMNFSAADETAYKDKISELRALGDQAAFLDKGRVEALDDRQSFADMAVVMAQQLDIEPAEAVIPLYLARVRLPEDKLTSEEQQIRTELAAAARSPDFSRRFVFINELVGSPNPETPQPKDRVVYVRRKGKRVKRIVHAREMAPAPKEVSVIEQVDWDKAEELADVADTNAHGWDRKPRESLRRYRRRLRHLRARCYEWVRRDLTTLGIWDASLFRGDVVRPTRYDRRRPVRAASFALAMAVVEGNKPLAAKTSLRQLNLRVDPLIRGSIVVFSQSVCGYDAKSGHIEIITSVDPLLAASFKFHPVKMECLVKASNENKVHVFVPLLADARRS
jgi:hypothetical protein